MSEANRESGAFGPLQGLRVVDFGHYYAGPMAAMLLADQGASVVRIVAPRGPELPEAQFRVLNRNKRILPLDLASADGQRRARELAARADVVIESFRPGVMQHRGLDRDSLEASNPGLIYLSLPGFPSSDAERAGIPGWEGVVGAAATLYTTGWRQALSHPPAYMSVPICSAFASVHGAIAVMSALIARERLGRGTSIEVPLVNAGLSACSRSFVFKGAGLRAGAPAGKRPPRFLESLAIEPEDPADERERKVRALGRLMLPNFATHHYETADGRSMLIMPIKPEMAKRFFRLLGLEGRLKAEGYVNESPWEAYDSGSGNNVGSPWTLHPKRTQQLIEWIGDVLRTRPAAEWEAALADAAIPFATLHTRDEWLGTEAHLHSGLLVRMEDQDPALTAPGRLADVSGPEGWMKLRFREPEWIEGDPWPRLPAAPRRDRPGGDVRKGEQLAGLKVLDLCNVVAGPNAAYTLAQYGAEVVRVEPPRSFNLPMHLAWTLEVNQGKRSVVLDAATAPGREAFERLVRWADVVVHNRLDDVAKRLGVTREQLQRINPRVVVCQNSAYGGTQPGGWERYPGYDPMPNLASGLDVLLGSLEEPRPATEIFADLMGGLGTGFAALLAVYQRDLTGFAGEGRSSLARAANFYQLPWMISEKGSSDWGEARGPFALGDSWWQRMYACRDGWVFVGSREHRREDLAQAVAGAADADEAALERTFATQDVAHWMSTLAAVDVACHPVLSMEDVCEGRPARRVDNEAADERAEGPLELLCWPDHPSGLPLLLPAPAWVQVGADRSYRRLTPTPRVGAHTAEVLADLGYTTEEVDELRRLRVAYDFLPAIGTPDSYFFAQQKVESP
ncbi:MAG: CoA transferase [Proteobacteria bacterium]|nr:CoA transferase [Pseudomonadota bacterium]